MKTLFSLIGILWMTFTIGAEGICENPFNTQPDVLLGFRKPGAATDLLVDAGPLSQFIGQSAPFKVRTLRGSGLRSIFGTNLTGLQFAAFSLIRVGPPQSETYQSLFVTRAWPTHAVPPIPWGPFGSAPLKNVGDIIFGIGANIAPFEQPPLCSTNAPGAYGVEPSNSSLSYSTAMGASGDLNRTFPGTVETKWPAAASLGSISVRTEFFQLAANRLPSRSIGTFDCLGDYEIWFTPASATPPIDLVILEITRLGFTNTITFSTLPGLYSYSLLCGPFTGVSSPVSQWTQIGASVTNSGGIMSLIYVSADPFQFYRVQAVP